MSYQDNLLRDIREELRRIRELLEKPVVHLPAERQYFPPPPRIDIPPNWTAVGTNQLQPMEQQRCNYH